MLADSTSANGLLGCMMLVIGVQAKAMIATVTMAGATNLTDLLAYLRLGIAFFGAGCCSGEGDCVVALCFVS